MAETVRRLNISVFLPVLRFRAAYWARRRGCATARHHVLLCHSREYDSRRQPLTPTLSPRKSGEREKARASALLLLPACGEKVGMSSHGLRARTRRTRLVTPPARDHAGTSR